MRRLVCSDIHLNINRRFQDTLDALEQIVQLVFKHKVNQVVIDGDTYTGRKPHSKERQAFHRFLYKITKAIPLLGGVGFQDVVDVHIIRGNHDEYPDGTHSYSEFTELDFPNVRVHENPTIIGGYFFGHMLLREAKLGPTDYQHPDSMSAKELIAKYPNCKAYLLGDVHKAQVIQKDPLVIYAGSINRVDFGERDDVKSILLIDDSPEFKCTRIALNSRPMLQYDIYVKENEDQSMPFSDIDIEGAIVKLVYHGTPEALKPVDENSLRDSMLKYCKELIIQYDVEKETIARDERVNENITPQQALDLYLEQIDLSDEEKEAIVKLSQKVTEDASA